MISKSRACAFASLMFGTLVIAGCVTNAPPEQNCSRSALARLNAEVGPITTQLGRKQQQLGDVRSELSRAQCTGTLFSRPSKAPECERLREREARLGSERLVLEKRLQALNTTILGQPQGSELVRGCRISWAAVRTHNPQHQKTKMVASAYRYTEARTKRTAGQKSRKAAIYRPVKANKSNIPDEVIGADMPAWTPPATPQPAPPAIKPTVTAPQPDQAYTRTSGVRVIGPAFLQDTAPSHARPSAPGGNSQGQSAP